MLKVKCIPAALYLLITHLQIIQKLNALKDLFSGARYGANVVPVHLAQTHIRHV